MASNSSVACLPYYQRSAGGLQDWLHDAAALSRSNQAQLGQLLLLCRMNLFPVQTGRMFKTLCGVERVTLCMESTVTTLPIQDDDLGLMLLTVALEAVT